jgi:hypothetical protein
MDNPLGYPQTPQPLESINLLVLCLLLALWGGGGGNPV